MELSAAVLGAPNAAELADFYSRLLGWSLAVDEGDWAMLRNPDGGVGLSFQSESGYIAPTWPAGPDDQQMMMHLDIGVADVATGVALALAAGATEAAYQPQYEVRVMLDPAGHPFCLFPIGNGP